MLREVKAETPRHVKDSLELINMSVHMASMTERHSKERKLQQPHLKFAKDHLDVPQDYQENDETMWPVLRN